MRGSVGVWGERESSGKEEGRQLGGIAGLSAR